MTELPDPLTPADTDLRDYPSMLLDVVRLRDSELAAGESAEAFRASVLSWCVAWHQLPAGSLPAEDGKLAYLLGYGRDLRTWREVREAGGLRGWVLCSDGRLYHPVVAEKVLGAIESRAKQKTRTEKARAAKAAADEARRVDAERARDATVAADAAATVAAPATETGHVYVANTVTENATEAATASKRSEVKGREVKEREGRSEAAPLTRARRAATVDVPPWIPSDAWNDYLEMRRSKRAVPTPRAVQLLIEQLDGYRIRGISVREVLNQSTRNTWTGVFEPKTDGGGGGRGASPRPTNHDWMVEEISNRECA